jgi:hypothetical protein
MAQECGAEDTYTESIKWLFKGDVHFHVIRNFAGLFAAINVS